MSTVREMIKANDFSQITASHPIDFRDFLLLTDSKIGNYGQYQVSEKGVEAKDLGDLSSCTAQEAENVYSFYEKAKLNFPTTVAELFKWIEMQNGDFILPEKFLIAVNAITDGPINTRYPPSRQRQQEQEILKIIKSLGHDPKALPLNNPGTPGIKSKVRQQFNGSKTVFDKAWQRLRDFGEIKDQQLAALLLVGV